MSYFHQSPDPRDYPGDLVAMIYDVNYNPPGVDLETLRESAFSRHVAALLEENE